MRLAVVSLLALIPIVWYQCAREAHLGGQRPMMQVGAFPASQAPSGAAPIPVAVAPVAPAPVAPAPVAQAPVAAATPTAPRARVLAYGQAHSFDDLRDGEALRLPDFVLTYVGRRTLGNPSPHVFTSTDPAGTVAQVPVGVESETTLSVGGVRYRIETRANAVKVTRP